jgi:hypothetical protein
VMVQVWQRWPRVSDLDNPASEGRQDNLAVNRRSRSMAVRRRGAAAEPGRPMSLQITNADGDLPGVLDSRRRSLSGSIVVTLVLRVARGALIVHSGCAVGQAIRMVAAPRFRRPCPSYRNP